MSIQKQRSDNSTINSPYVIANGQHNLVLLIVDQLSDPQPEFQGIWLLITLPHSSKITLVPVFPAQHASETFTKTFTVTKENQPGDDFLQLLTEKFLWHDYLVIDRTGIAAVFETFDPVLMDTLNIDFPGDTRSLLEQQTSLWLGVCDFLPRFEGQDAFTQKYHQVSSHFTTSFNMDDLPLFPWGAGKEEDKLGCEFPTLNLISP